MAMSRPDANQKGDNKAEEDKDATYTSVDIRSNRALAPRRAFFTGRP